MSTAKNIVGILLVLAVALFIMTLAIIGAYSVLEINTADREQCGMWYCVTPTVNVLNVQLFGCPLVEEQPTATPTAVLCEITVVPTVTPTHGTPPSATRTPEPANTLRPSSTPEPTSTDIPPEPTKTPKLKCNKGEGNGGEGCDPGNNPDGGNDDED